MANSFAANVTSAQVLAVQGQAWVTDANGNKTPLTANDQIRLNDLLNTDTQSVLMLAIGRDAVVTLGQSEKMRFDKAFLAQLDNKEVEGSIQGAVNFDAIEQAIAEGRSLDDVLPSAAAGETGGGDGSAGTSGVRIDLTAERVTPDSGFETNTQGFDGNRRFEDIGGRDSDGLFVAAPTPILSIDALAIDDVLNAQEQAQPLVITGQAANVPNGSISVTFNGAVYTATVVDGVWSATVPSADLLAAADGQYTVSVTAGTASASRGFSIDSDVNGAIGFSSPVTPDNFLTLAEATGNIPISGSVTGDFTAGDLVTLTVNGVAYTAAVAADGSFTVDIAGTDLQADSDLSILASFTATDAAGNSLLVTNQLSYQAEPVNQPGSLVISGSVQEDEVLTAVLTDPDGLSPAVSYQWFSNGVAIDGATGSTFQLADAQVGTVITVRAVYTDALGETSTITSAATAPVANINDAPTIDSASGSTQVENVAVAGDIVATFVANDLDGDILTYSITSGNANGYFEILDPNSGVVTLTAAGQAAIENDTQTLANQIIGVTASDGTATSAEATATVNIVQVIENTAPVLGADTSASVAENTTLVGNYAATDAEGDTITYSLGGADAALFSIDASGNLSFVSAPDYETNPGPFDVQVIATDDGEGTLSTTQTIAVSVSNVIENTAPVLGADTSASVAENTTLVGNYAATDAEGDTITYSLGGADAALFSIDANGNLSFVSAPDYETNPGPFDVQVIATDDGEGTLSSTQTIAVSVSNVIENTAPVLGADTSASVAENTTLVGNYAATDAEGDTITYSLGGADAALFSIDASGNLSFVSAPDYETNPGPFDVQVIATDDGEGTLSTTQTIAVSVSNVIENTAPVLGADTSASVAENTTLVGNYAATDAEGDTITYSLGGADAALFSIDASGNLSFVSAPDYETNPGPFDVQVIATDDGEGTLSSTQTIAVSVSNVIENTAPVLGADTSASVAENTTLVGNYAATDAEGDTITYSLGGADAALFTIDASGNLSFVSAPDYETNPGPFDVQVIATDDGEGTLSTTQTIAVSVSNVIENTAPVLGADTSASVAENTTLVGNYAATDAEGDTITYSLGGADAALFTIDASGNLSFVSAPDYETNPGPFDVQVIATDDGEGTLSTTQTIAVSVSNVIENTAPVLGADTSASVAENTTLVGNYAATDAEGDTITYSLGGADAALFSIDASGNLSFVSAPDYETNPGPFDVQVIATDDGEGTLSTTQTIAVSVSNVIENTAPVLGADTSASVAENTTLVGNYAATDAEGDTITYTLGGADAALFSIDASGNLSFVSAPDYETNPGPFDVQVIATDDGEGTLSSTQTIAVSVSNVIENTAPVLGADTSASVAENTTLVGNYAATDAEGDTITYSLGGADAALFSIDASGNLSFVSAPDYETNPGPFDVQVIATDDGEGTLSTTQTIAVSVSNVIENTAPVLGADTSASVAENTTLVGNYAATDAEGDTITYTLGGADAALFSIDASGNLSFVSAPDYETNPGPFDVQVIATDDGEGTLSSTQTIAVSVSNVIENTAPVLGADTSASVAENTTLVGNYAATDAEGDTITYSLGGADAALFSIDASGNLSFVSAPDYETNPGPFDVQVIATDDGEGTLSTTQTIAVSVSNVIENTAPVLGADTSASVAENTTLVGNYAATDAEGDTITYSLGGADAALFSIDASGNLSFVSAPDYETNPGPFDVQVIATDDGEGTLSSTQTIAVSVSNVIENTAPVLGADTSASVAENTTLVGNYAATDAEGDTITYSLGGADAALFTIDASGNLSFVSAPDYETNPGPFDVQVIATDDGEGTLSTTQTIAVSVSNVIENTAPVLGADTSASVAENTTLVGNYAATDAEGDTITYSLGGADAALFTIDASGNLSFVSAPDYETNPGPFDVQVIATDDGEGTLSTTQTIAVSVSNVIENTAPVLGADTSASVAENTTLVGNYAATDAEGDTITYSLGGADAALFSIDASGNLSFVSAPDYETNPGPFDVQVIATDDGEGSLSTTQTIAVSVSNVIENTAPVLGADTSASVAENTTLVGNYAATDAEGDTITYTLGGADAALFSIDASGNLSFVSAPDYETNPGPFDVQVIATDDGEGTLSSTQTIAVSVSNVIENTAPVLGADTSASVAENTTLVGNYAATDAEGDTITYSLGGADAALFTIDASGNLSFVSAPDYETNPGPFDVQVIATDDGEGSLSTTQTIAVSVSNVIENTAPVLGADTSASVAENTTLVGNYAATDAEGDTITYTLGGADAALFSIDASGNLSFVSAPDYETNPGPFDVQVIATDDGEGTLSSTQTIAVSVSNVIENTAPVLGADTSASVAENTTLVGNYAATDAEGDTITYSLGGADAALFTIDASGNLSFVSAPDYETNPGPFDVQVIATDDGEGTLSTTQTIAVSVSNVIENTAPVLGADTSASVAENTTLVGNYAATDAEGDTITYTLGGADAALFSIDASGNLSFVSAPDYETNPGPFDVQVIATDDGEGSLSTTQTIAVSVSNVIENTAPVLGADTSASVAENTTLVGNYAATDAEGDTITYSLGGADAALFSIDASGNLSFVSAPDYETNPGPFDVQVIATDDGEGTLSTTQTIAVSVSNVIENTAPVLGADTSASVAENTTLVGNYAATDAEGDTITYSLGGADAALFTIDASGNLSFVSAPDYETNPGPFDVQVIATDDGEGTLSTTQTIAVSVSNVIENTAPVLGADTSASVAENTTLVGNYAATDAEGDTITYSLGGADAALFTIDASGNLSFVSAPDYETNPGPFDVQVIATDDGEGTLSTTQTIAVSVSNVIENTAPVLGADTSASVAENTTLVGNYAATDAEGDTITYSLGGADAALFSIDASGNLSFVSAPDYETNPGPFDVQVIATDDGEGTLSTTQTIAVSVSNVIENTAPVLGADTSASVAENTTLVGNYAATDAEGDTITYTLGGADAALFSIDASGNLSFVSAPDYETNPGPFDVQVIATDDGEGTLSSTQTIAVSVSNVIENTAPVLGADTSASVAENTTLVGNYAATDAEGDTITYSLGGADAALFSIDASGNLSFVSAPDYETNPGPFDVQVIATDDGEGTLSTTQTIAVSVSNVIENTAPVLGADTSASVAENTTLVGNYAATDAEGDTITYTLGGADAALFSIDASGNLSFVSAPDYETNPGPFDVQVIATDDGEGTLSSTQTIAVSVSNVIENTAPVLGADTSASVAENTTLVGNYAATDAEGDTITYSLGGADAALFSIDASGNLSFVSAPDYETNPGPFDVQVIATDDGEGTLSTTQTIAVSVSNVIENTAPVLGADTSASVAENTTLVGNYAATDAEGDTITYSLGGADAALFSIDASGNLSFVSAPDYETNPGPFDVQVIATDDGEGTLSSTQTIAVSVSNVNDVAAVIDLDGNNSSGASGFNYQTSFTEGGAPVRIADVDVQISDADSALITAARVQISNVEAGDFLTVGTLPAGIVASAYNPTTGLLTLSGSASLAAYQSAIRAVQFTNDGSASGAAKDIQVSVNDGSAWSNVAHTSVTMVLVPTVSISDMSVQEPQSGTTTLTFTINIDTPPASNLTFTYQTVNGSAQGGSDYQQVGPLTGTILAGQTSTTVSITINSDANVYEGDENFYLNVTGFNQTVNYAPGSHLITNGVQAVGTIGANNGAPVAEDDLYLTGQDEVLVTGNVLANDTLVDGAVVSTFDSLSSAGGSVSYNGDGTFTYTPANGFVGTDTFTYTLIDDDGEIDTATVTVEVSDVTISPPTIGALADVTYVENAVGTALFDGLTITDADSNNLSSVVVTINGFINAQDVIDYLTAGTNVTAVVNQTGTTWQLTLSGGADIGEYITVLDTLTYQNSSENPSVSIRNVSLTAYDQNFANIFDSEAFQLQVTPVNDAPQVFDNSKFVVEGTLSTPLNIQAPTDVDSDDSQLLITVLTLPDITTGIVMMADGLTQVTVGQVLTLGQLTSLVFDASGAEASDTFTYSVFDGELTTIGTTALNVGATQPDFNTVYESGLPSGSGVEGQSAQASGNLFDNDGSGGGTLTSIQFNSTTYSPVGGVITVTTPLGVLTVDANTGDYTYQLSTSNSTGTDVNEVFTYNFVNVTPLSDNLTITIVDDIPIASNVAQTIPESEENIFNLMFSLDISTSMNAAVGSSGDTRLSLAKESLVSLAEEYFNQSTQVSLTLLLFANGAHRVGTFTDFESAKAAIQAVTDVNQTSYSNHLGTGSLTNQTSYVDALSMIRNEFTADLAGQNSADNIQNISYFLSDGAVTADGSPVNMGYREFVNANGIKSYSVGIGDGLPTNLTDLNYAHNIDAYGRGHGTIDNALIVSDVSLLKSELLSTVPTAFGGNITQEGTITRVAMGADGGHVASIEILLGDPAVAHTISYDGVNFSVSPALPVSLEIDGTKVILDANDGFQYGTFTMDFADGSYLFIAPNGNAGSEFSFNYTVVDGDNDSASATARFYIVDDKPDARDDLHVGDYYQPLEGNVISGVGTDGGPALGSGFTPFAIQGGGVDKVVDNADVSNVKYKGIEFDLDFTTAPAAGSSGTLSWSYSTETDINGTLIREIVVTDSSDLSTLVFRSNGYYNFARDGGVDHSVNTTSLTNVNNSGFSLAGFSASGASSAITYQSTGIGVQGGGWNDRINQGERVDINFMSKGLNPFGVHDITFTLTSYDRAAESVTLVIYGVDGVTVLGTENVTGATLTISRLDYPQIGKVSFIADTADTYVRISNITYTTLSSDALLAANAPVLIDYTLTDSDGQSDIAQLALYTINNTITGTAGNDNIIGGALNDAITGAAGDDILSGGAGNDSISGGAGKDIISGGTGNDYLSGGADNDELYGNDGDDHLAGDAGNDLLDGGIGADILLGGAGDDQLFGGADNDRLYGGDGNDKLYGGSGDDLLVGEAGDDLLNGGTGNDILYGGLDQDTLIGGEGDDILFGGRGDDTLTGGNGSDRFMWVAGNAGTDTVTDFNVGEGDVLDLSDLLIGEESGDLLDYLQFSVVDGNTYISVDANAGASFETGQVIILQGLDLTAAGTLTNQQIIDDLLTGGNLYVDS